MNGRRGAPTRRTTWPLLAMVALLTAACASDDEDGAANAGASPGTTAAASPTTEQVATTMVPDEIEPTTAQSTDDTMTDDTANDDTTVGGWGAVEDRFTPVVMDVMSTPQWFTGTDGLIHLVYELELRNAFPAAATITEVEVREVGTDRVLETLTGDALTGSVSPMGLGTQPQTDFAPGTVGVVWLDIELDGPDQLPAEIEHEVTISVEPGFPIPEEISDVGGRAEVDQQPPTVIGPPLEGPGWIALGSCCDGPHRRALQPVNGGLWLGQRFAIDFNKINEDGLVVVGDATVNEDYPTYDQPVLAVADATVAMAADELEDQIAAREVPVPISQADGNFVILEVEEGKYAFYAHLKPGSVAVQTGDTVEKGEIIASTGNSGSSSGPHLHFHMMDAPTALAGNGVPYVFDEFTLTGTSPPADELMQTDPATDPVPVDTATAGPRRDEFPLGADVVEFAAVES